MDATQTVKALNALAHRTRLGAFKMLVQAGPPGMTPSAIAQELALAMPVLSFHLKELSHSGLVVVRRDGRNIHYSADFESTKQLIAYLTENCCGGEPCAVDAVATTCCDT